LGQKTFLKLFLLGSALGSLQRINLLSLGSGHGFHMGSQIAVTVFPFRVRFRASGAVPFGCEFGFAVAAVTLLNDFMAQPAVVGTTGRRHKIAFLAFSDSCTKHWNHLLLQWFLTKKKGWENSPAFKVRSCKFAGTINTGFRLVKQKEYNV
jgi:hypothetical protein